MWTGATFGPRRSGTNRLRQNRRTSQATHCYNPSDKIVVNSLETENPCTSFRIHVFKYPIQRRILSFTSFTMGIYSTLYAVRRISRYLFLLLDQRFTMTSLTLYSFNASAIPHSMAASKAGGDGTSTYTRTRLLVACDKTRTTLCSQGHGFSACPLQQSFHH